MGSSHKPGVVPDPATSEMSLALVPPLPAPAPIRSFEAVYRAHAKTVWVRLSRARRTFIERVGRRRAKEKP
jgi:hypothetical protein